MFIFSLCFISRSFSQLHQIHVEPTENNVSKASFYSLSDGYVGFTNFVGFTTDTGRTFTPKYINTGNVNFNGYGVNLTFGFEISGVKAFNKNTLIVFGDYGLEPSILYSTDQGNTFKLVFHAAYDPSTPGSFISDMVFPANGSTGYAVYTDNILRTTDDGLSWLINKTLPFNVFTNLQAINNNQVYAIGAYAGNTSLFATMDAGNSWQQIQIPQGNLKCAYNNQYRLVKY